MDTARAAHRRVSLAVVVAMVASLVVVPPPAMAAGAFAASALDGVSAPISAVSPTIPDGAAGWYRAAPAVTLISVVPGLTMQYSFEAEPATWTTYSAPVMAPEGISLLQYRSFDGVGASDVAYLDFKVDSGAPSIEITAPASLRQMDIPVSWNGTDTVSGIGSYAVDVKENNGGWTPWLATTTATADVYHGNANSRYRFRAQPTDVAGNVGLPAETADTVLDTPLPVTTVSAPPYSTTASTTRAFTVSWQGTGAFWDVKSYRVEVRVGALGTWTPWIDSTSTVSAVYSGTAGSTYYFRALAVDIPGNVGAWSAPSVGTCVPYDQTKASFSHGWATVSRSSAYLGSAKYTTHSGSYANLTLTKGTVYLLATVGPKMGKLAVYYRGRRVGTIDTYSKTTRYRRVFKLATYATGSGSSTIKIVNLATHNRPRIEVDGFALW